MRLSFFGAVGEVTGSSTLVETSRARVLVDFGMHQGGHNAEARNRRIPPLRAEELDAVVLTHAHIDHSGRLPMLIDEGYRGRIHATPATIELCDILLRDSAHIQQGDADRLNRRRKSSGRRPAEPLYTETEVGQIMQRFDASHYGRPVEVAPGIAITYHDAGHILGSSTVALDLADSGRRVLFSGDLGRPRHPLLVPPTPPTDADVIVLESTYGGRQHDDTDAIDQLARIIDRTAARGGTVLIPAFAVDRTEVVLLRLRELMASGRIPTLPVHADSPMALRALDVYRTAIEEGAADIRPELRGQADPFDTGHLHEVRDVEGSKALAQLTGPSIIISASGMATGGRVLHHLARLLPDPRNAVVLVGFQAEGTRGRRLADRPAQLKMMGTYVRVRAEVANLRSFSVHADHDELMGWLRSARPAPELVHLVHGEQDGAEALRDAIEVELDWHAVVPRHLERVRL